MADFPIELALQEDEEMVDTDSDGPGPDRTSEDRSPSPLLMHRKTTRQDKPARNHRRRPAVRAHAPVQANDKREEQAPPTIGFNFNDDEYDRLPYEDAVGYVHALDDDLEGRAEHPLRDQITPNATVPPPGYVLIRHNPRIARPIASLRSADGQPLNLAPPPATPDPLLEPLATIYTTLTSSRPSLLATPLSYTPTISAYPPASYKGPIAWNRVWKHISIKSTATKANMVDFLGRCGVPREVYDAPGVKNRDLYPYITRHQELNREAKERLEGR